MYEFYIYMPFPSKISRKCRSALLILQIAQILVNTIVSISLHVAALVSYLASIFDSPCSRQAVR